MTTCPHCTGIHDGTRGVCPLCGRGLLHELPSRDEITAACVAIRRTWPKARLRHCELYEELEIAVAHRVSDHMRRSDGEWDLHK